jgi:hypothetical protein
VTFCGVFSAKYHPYYGKSKKYGALYGSTVQCLFEKKHLFFCLFFSKGKKHVDKRRFFEGAYLFFTALF